MTADPMVEMATGIRRAYAGSGAGWAAGPGRIYDRLSEELVAASPEPLAGALVLDLGAGTGAASRAVEAVSGHPVAVDLALGMLRHDRLRRPPAAVGDALALPFCSGAFDAVVAAFSVSHVLDPQRALAEAARVTRAGGVVLAGVFSARNFHPAKMVVEAAAADFGYRRPSWYERLKSEVEPRTNQPDAFAGAARAAGLTDVTVAERRVDLGPQSPFDLVAWRLGTPSLAPFVATHDPEARAAFVAAAVAAVGPEPEPLVLFMLVLSGRVRGDPIRP